MSNDDTEILTFSVEIIRVTEKAFLAKFGVTAKEEMDVWVPKSLATLPTGEELDSIEESERILIGIPEWFAIQEELEALSE